MERDERVALVTGASSGIGRATAAALADRGLSVAATARREDRLDELADRIRSEGGEALAVPADLTDSDQVAETVETVRRRYGRLDLLVNAAGVLHRDAVADAAPSEWREMVEVNLLAAMEATHHAVPAMQERGTGHVVVVSSLNARKSSAEGSGYCASKAGVTAFAESLRREVAADGVRVTAVEPGMVATEMHDESLHEEVPMLDPEDVAEAVVFAVSRPDRASVNEILLRPTEQEF